MTTQQGDNPGEQAGMFQILMDQLGDIQQKMESLKESNLVQSEQNPISQDASVIIKCLREQLEASKQETKKASDESAQMRATIEMKNELIAAKDQQIVRKDAQIDSLIRVTQDYQNRMDNLEGLFANLAKAWNVAKLSIRADDSNHRERHPEGVLEEFIGDRESWIRCIGKPATTAKIPSQRKLIKKFAKGDLIHVKCAAITPVHSKDFESERETFAWVEELIGDAHLRVKFIDSNKTIKVVHVMNVEKMDLSNDEVAALQTASNRVQNMQEDPQQESMQIANNREQVEPEAQNGVENEQSHSGACQAA